LTRSISETVRFRDLPGFPRLFIDLVEGNPSARQFFPNMPDRDNLLAQAARLQAETWPRTAICDLLREQARRFSSDETAFANIQRLQSTNAVIVLAVLRPRLLGGSLADWSQAMTAARMAGWLGKRGIPAVPVVGIVMDRAQEGLTARVFSREGNKEFSLGGFSGPESTIPGYVGALHEQLAHTLGISAGDSHVLADLASAFSQGSDLTVAFGSFLSRTLASLGLIFFNPPENGSLLVPAGVPENAMGPVRSSQAARLAAAGYLPARSDTGPGQGAPTYRGDLPVSLMLPVAVEVLGEGNVHEAACDQALFESLGRIAPCAWPRASVSLVDLRSRRVLARYGLHWRELFAGPHELKDRLVPQELVRHTLGSLDMLADEVRRSTSRLMELVPSGARLRSRTERAGARMAYQVAKLKDRYLRVLQRRSEAVDRQVSRLCSFLAPGRQLQEQYFPGFALMIRHPGKVPELVYESIDPWKFEHQVLSLD